MGKTISLSFLCVKDIGLNICMEEGRRRGGGEGKRRDKNMMEGGPTFLLLPQFCRRPCYVVIAAL